MWRMLGAARRQGDPLVRHAGGGSERQERDDARGSAGHVVEKPRHDRGDAGRAAPAAAGLDRRAGAPLRLLPERDVDPGGRPAGDDEAADDRADQDRDERPPVPVRHVSADPDRDPEGGRDDGEGRNEMSALEKQFSRNAFVKGGGALVVSFTVAGAVLGGKARAADPHPYTSYGPADSSQIDSWLAINADNTAS